MQQDGIESLHSDRESVEEELSFLVLGRDRGDFWPKSFKIAQPIGPRVSKVIGWNAAYLAYCFFGRRHLICGASWGCRGHCQRGSDCNITRNSQRSVKVTTNMIPIYMLLWFILVCYRPSNFVRKCAVVTFPIDVFQIFNFKNVVTLKSGSEVTQGHWKWYHSIDLIWFPIRPKTCDPHRQVCAAQRPRPSRKATATWTASTSRRRPHKAIDSANSQSPLFLAAAASKKLFLPRVTFAPFNWVTGSLKARLIPGWLFMRPVARWNRTENG